MNLKFGFWQRLFRWKSVCSDIQQQFDSVQLELDKAKLQIHFYEQQILASKSELDRHKSHLHEARSELEGHREKHRRAKEGNRVLLHFIAQAHGLKVKAVVAFGILLSCCSWGAFPPPFIRNTVDTNTLGNAPSTLYFLGWNGTKPAWGIPVGSNDVVIAGAGVTVVTNYVTGGVTYTVASSNAVVAAGSISTVSTNVVSGGIVYTVSSPDPTNQATVVSNGVAAHTVTVAGTANQITSSVGTAQTIAANPATTLSLPDPLIAPGKVSANVLTNRDFAAIGVVTNDANGKFYTTPTLPNALLGNSSLTIAGTASQIAVAGGGPVSLGGTATLSIPTAPQLTNLFNSGDQYRTNGATSTTSLDLIASNALGSVSVVSGLITATATSGAAFKSPTNTPAVGQQLNVTSTAGDTAYQNPHYLSTILGGQYVWTGVVNSQARYCPPNGFQSSATTATEASTSVAFPAGTLTNLYVRLVSLGSSTNMTVTVMVNNAASNLAVSINGNGSTQTSVDTTHSATVTDQQAVDIRIVANCPTAPSGSVLLYWSLQFAQ